MEDLDDTFMADIKERHISESPAGTFTEHS